MNSADKLNGVQGSQRDVKNAQGLKWDQVPAYTDPLTPIDESMGAGHLNVQRAIQHVAAGPYEPNIPNTLHYVPPMGFSDWFIAPGQTQEYIIDPTIGAGTWATLTLCWDRSPQLPNQDTYNYGDQFFYYEDHFEEMADLDLYLVGMTSGEPVALSTSYYYTEEHIFFQLTGEDRYKIVVHHAGGKDESVRYGLAWQIGEAPSVNPGDHNKDGKVDSADYVTWRKDPASYGGSGGYDEWRTNFGNTYGSGSGASLASVPEPSSLLLFAIAAVFGAANRRRAV